MAAASPHLAIPGMPDDLDRVEHELLSSVDTPDPFLTEVASHLIRAGGKRMRPAFAIAAAATGHDHPASASHEVVLGGVAVELVHLGSLYHDDVMDDATTRRTVESVNARWGNLKAILAGDFLLAKASEIAASLGTEVAGLLAATIGRLCEGQYRELKDLYNVERSVEDYEVSISGKTAALFATAARVGALVADLPRERVEALTRFGEHYGLAFQVVDDVLDLVASTEQLGKPSGHDMVEGVYTLPVLHVLAGPRGDELRQLLGRPLDDRERQQARDIVRSTDAIEVALDVARSHVVAAEEDLARFAPSPGVDGLNGTARHLLERVTALARS